MEARLGNDSVANSIISVVTITNHFRGTRESTPRFFLIKVEIKEEIKVEIFSLPPAPHPPP